jgi:CRISPR type III-B/RAMP module RAMP protein Cmr1
MFIAGADPSGTPELRAASFKGALRFWWRALSWSRLDCDLMLLRKEEAQLFGSSDAGQTAVRLRLAADGHAIGATAANWSATGWENYTGYGLKDASREPIEPGSVVQVKLTATGRDTLSRPDLAVALKVLGLCGGLGARSRNAWGSLTLLSLGGVCEWEAPIDRNSLRQSIQELLNTENAHTDSPPYTAISRHTKVAVGRRFPSAEKAQRRLAESYRECVQSQPKDNMRWQFGIPRRSSRHPSMDNSNRRAKPLFLHVHEAQSGAAFPVVLYVPAQWLENSPALPGGGKAIEELLARVEHS